MWNERWSRVKALLEKLFPKNPAPFPPDELYRMYALMAALDGTEALGEIMEGIAPADFSRVRVVLLYFGEEEKILEVLRCDLERR